MGQELVWGGAKLSLDVLKEAPPHVHVNWVECEDLYLKLPEHEMPEVDSVAQEILG